MVKSVWHYEQRKDSCIRAFLVCLTSGHALAFHRAIFLEWNGNKLMYRHGVGQIERSTLAAVGEQVEKLEFAELLRRALDSPDWGHHDGLHESMREPLYSIAAYEFENATWWQDEKGELVASHIGTADSWIARPRQRINARAFLVCPVSIHDEPKGVVRTQRALLESKG